MSDVQPRYLTPAKNKQQETCCVRRVLAAVAVFTLRLLHRFYDVCRFALVLNFIWLRSH
jgi:hypothetical protein